MGSGSSPRPCARWWPGERRHPGEASSVILAPRRAAAAGPNAAALPGASGMVPACAPPAWCQPAGLRHDVPRGGPEMNAPVGTSPVAGEAPVARAAATPDRPQPYRELGLTDEEYQRIRELLGRRPTDPELALYSVMWSEHCSYKSSRRHLRQFADQAPPVKGDGEAGGALLAGIGHNAGVVDIGQGYAATFKIESHNHPSYVEPFQGAATGIGGLRPAIPATGPPPRAPRHPPPSRPPHPPPTPPPLPRRL